MSDARPFYLPGSERLAAIGERVRRSLHTVAQEWWTQPQGLQVIAVTPLESAAQSIRSSRLRYVARDGDAWLGYIAPDFACVKLAEGWLGCEISSPGPLVETLEREFCQGLFAELRGAEGAAVVLTDSDWSQLPATELHAGAGTVVIEIDIDGVPVTLIAPARLWPELLDATVRPSSRALGQVAAAVPDTRIRLEARLPAVQVPFAEVGALAPGDFIDLQLDLSGSVRLVSRDIELSVPALLGKSDGQRAIQLNTLTGTTT
jgi:hypothetical protein